MKLNRRQTIRSLAWGGLILPGLISDLMAAGEKPLAPRRPHFEPKAKWVIFMFMTGGVSHMDTFDPKPYLNKNHNKITGKGKRYYKGADWAFRRHGQAGTAVSDSFPHIGSMMDDICVIRSMKTSTATTSGRPSASIPGDREGFGWQCMVARRLAEREVRFIELIDGDTRIDYNWDTQANMSNCNKLARNVDQPIAGLLKDLKSRGMLEDTLVVFAT